MRQDNPQTTSLIQEPSAVPQGLSQQEFTQFLCHIWLYFVELLFVSFAKVAKHLKKKKKDYSLCTHTELKQVHNLPDQNEAKDWS